ncbi:MAG: pilus assembly protein [Hyphomicrobiaceae bacterium]|nr:pilus assembly protein [Hyphomicrobiaceae bacterium]
MSNFAQLMTSASRRLHRLWRDRRGVAAVEFGYIAPILLLLLMGTFEVSRAISIDRRINTVSANASEIIAREEKITNADLAKIVEAMKHIMTPYADDSLVVRIIGVRASSTDANDTRVEWSYQYANGSASTPLTKCSTYALDAGLVGKNGSVIVAEVGYNYEPVFGDFIYRGLDFTSVDSSSGDDAGVNRNWSSRAVHAPRKSCVDYNNTNCVLNCAG